MTPIRQIHHLEILRLLGTFIRVQFPHTTPLFYLFWGFFLWMRLNWYDGAPALQILCACLKHGNLVPCIGEHFPLTRFLWFLSSYVVCHCL